MDFEYINKIKNLVNNIEKYENKTMKEATNILIETIENKKSIFIFGASHAGILSEELYYRAGGLVVINPIFARELMLDTLPITHTSEMERLEGYGVTLANKTPISEGDILIVHSVSGRNPVSIELAMEAKKKGAKVICITNLSYSKEVTSRHNSGKKLYEVSDLVIDNHGEKGDACVEIKGTKQKVAPTSTVASVVIMNSIIALIAENLNEKKVSPLPIFYSANIDGGDELNKKVYDKYKDVIHYKY